MLGLDALTMLFWFAGFIALAVFDRDLHDVDVITYFGNEYRGCDFLGNLCGTITAAVVFGAFEWYVVIVSSDGGLEVMEVYNPKKSAMLTIPFR